MNALARDFEVARQICLISELRQMGRGQRRHFIPEGRGIPGAQGPSDPTAKFPMIGGAELEGGFTRRVFEQSGKINERF